jgi:hypothetical protein
LTIPAGFIIEINGVEQEKIGENIVVVPHIKETNLP